MDNNNKKVRRIGIDARLYGPVGKGLGRYTQEIVDNIIAIDRENEYVIFLRKENYHELRTDNPKVKKVLADIRWYTLAEQLLMPFYIWRARVDFMHFPHFNVPLLCPRKFIVTIHDLILIKYPTARATTLGPVIYKIKNWGYRAVILNALGRAQKVIAVSEFTKNDIAKTFRITPNKIVVTYEGVARLSPNTDNPGDGIQDDKKTLFKYNIDKPFLLYVGNAYPHKNLEGLLRVFKRIIDENQPEIRDLQLVLVGKDDYFYSRVSHYAKKLSLIENSRTENPVIFSGYVPDSELEVLYKCALAYIFPSCYEGFGLPPLEAMAADCPVASSDKTCLPEVLGQAALYFDPENEDDMRGKIIRIITDGNLRENLVSRGQKQAGKYGWKECAEKTLEIYKTIF